MENKIPNNQLSEEQMRTAFEFSGEMFSRQFDPNSILYHQGSQQLVPLGGQNIPESMPTVYDPEYLKQQPKEIESSSSYKQLLELRNLLTDLKQFLNKLSAHMEGIYRHNDKFKLKGNPNNSKHVSILQKNIEKEIDEAKQYQNQIDQINKIIINFNNPCYNKLSEYLVKIMEASLKDDFRIQEKLIAFNQLISVVTKEIFNQSQNILDELKKLKLKNISPVKQN